MIQEQLVTEDEPIVAEVGRKQALRKTFSESTQLLNLLFSQCNEFIAASLNIVFLWLLYYFSLLILTLMSLC